MNPQNGQKHYPKCVLITGSTDGIGLLTAKMFCRNTPHALILGLHGRDPERLKRAEETVRNELTQRRNNDVEVTLVSFCHDLSSMQAVRELARDVETRLPSLDCLINNAALFDKGGPNTTSDGYERTFQVNVLAPFILTILLARALKGSLTRILNTSSMSHTDSRHHLKQLDYANLQHEKGFDVYSAYGLSKLLVNMFTTGLKAADKDLKDITVITMDPGTVNTKMLLSGWGRCGIEVDDATDTYYLATCDKYVNTEVVEYYEHQKKTRQAEQVYDKQRNQELVDYLLKLTKLEL